VVHDLAAAAVPGGAACTTRQGVQCTVIANFVPGVYLGSPELNRQHVAAALVQRDPFAEEFRRRVDGRRPRRARHHTLHLGDCARAERVVDDTLLGDGHDILEAHAAEATEAREHLVRVRVGVRVRGWG
jgi:hypothetical protein